MKLPLLPSPFKWDVDREVDLTTSIINTITIYKDLGEACNKDMKSKYTEQLPIKHWKGGIFQTKYSHSEMVYLMLETATHTNNPHENKAGFQNIFETCLNIYFFPGYEMTLLPWLSAIICNKPICTGFSNFSAIIP